ncbi:3-hydroxyacyl-CoA dehydrogenase family protein, partial [Clostridium perfringens]
MNIKNVAVLGTGTMGHGIALLSAKAGLNVKMYGRTDESLDRGISSIIASLNRLTIQGNLSEFECQEILGRIKGVKTLEEVAEDTDFIIESVAENLELKQNIFNKLDSLCGPEVILASNTSGLSPTDIA